jgi:hypothetical protein
MIVVVERYNGIIVDFMATNSSLRWTGDRRHPGECGVSCAIEMRWNNKSSPGHAGTGVAEIHMGIGIHTGEVVVGHRHGESGVVLQGGWNSPRGFKPRPEPKDLISEQRFTSFLRRVTLRAIAPASRGFGDRELYEVDCVTGKGPAPSINDQRHPRTALGIISWLV